MSDKILVVDDDPAMVRTLCDILRMRGWNVDGVHSGEAALAAMGTTAYSLVLMDIIMPGIDGVGALKEMRRSYPGTRVVLMTAHTAQERIAEALREGAIQVMSKPIDLPSLMTLLSSRADAPSVLGRYGPS